MDPDQFFLGIPEGRWLSLGQVEGRVFLSDERLATRKSALPRGLFDDGSPVTLHPWGRDCSGYTIVGKHGDHITSVADYVAREQRWRRDTIGAPEWSAAQDYVCHPKVLRKWQRTIRDHQRMTIDRYVQLRALAPEGHWVPVLQGWDVDDYLRHVDDYLAAGIDLTQAPLVGVGSTSDRQAEALPIYLALHDLGLKMHGFGIGLQGIQLYHWLLVSADSMAWSQVSRKESADPGWAANSPVVAEVYRARIHAAIRGDEYEAKRLWEYTMTLLHPKKRMRARQRPRRTATAAGMQSVGEWRVVTPQPSWATSRG